MRYRLALALTIALAAGVATHSGSSNSGAQATASISGVVFEDLDGDGVRDAGERDSAHLVELMQDGSVIDDDPATGGSFVFDGLLPGTYSVRVRLDVSGSATFCDRPPTINPLPCSDGAFFPFKWKATSPELVEVTIASGEAITVNFGVQQADILTVAGTAILNDNYATDGTPLTAYYDENLCGEGIVGGQPEASSAGLGQFEFDIAGAGEVDGCALDGERVEVRVGGVRTLEDITWETGRDDKFQHLLAMPDHAWYWLELPAADNGDAIGAAVEAVIDGRVCGSAIAEEIKIGLSILVGFARLIVPRDTLAPGCGHEGTAISFRIDGREFMTAEWSPGVHQLNVEELRVAPTALPDTGGQPAEDGAPFAAVLATAIAAIGVSMLGAGLRRTS